MEMVCLGTRTWRFWVPLNKKSRNSKWPLQTCSPTSQMTVPENLMPFHHFLAQNAVLTWHLQVA
jgi:hypothetical protein